MEASLLFLLVCIPMSLSQLFARDSMGTSDVYVNVYWSTKQSPAGLSNAAVFLLCDLGGGDDFEVASSYLDSTGYCHMSYSQLNLCDVVYLQVNLASADITVDDSDGVYFFTGGAYNPNTTGSTHISYTIYATQDPDMTYVNIYTSLESVVLWSQLNAWRNNVQVPVYYEPSQSYSQCLCNSGQALITYAEGAQYQVNVIGHEWGHRIWCGVTGTIPTTSGPQTDIYSYCSQIAQSVEFTLAEGFAIAFGMASTGSSGTFEDSTDTYQVEKYSCPYRDMSTDIFRLAAAIWDLYDAANDSNTGIVNYGSSSYSDNNIPRTNMADILFKFGINHSNPSPQSPFEYLMNVMMYMADNSGVINLLELHMYSLQYNYANNSTAPSVSVTNTSAQTCISGSCSFTVYFTTIDAYACTSYYRSGTPNGPIGNLATHGVSSGRLIATGPSASSNPYYIQCYGWSAGLPISIVPGA